MNKLFRVLVAVAAVLFFLTGCGNNPPELKQIYSQINFIKTPDSETVNTELLVLVNAEDEDGDDDIEFIHIIDDKRQIFWTADSGSWSIRNSRGMKWFGGEHFSSVDGSPPEAGTYRILLTDRAGERVEDSIVIPLIKDLPKADDFPELIITDNPEVIEIKSRSKRNLISFYDSAGTLLGASAVSPGKLNIQKMRNFSAIKENYTNISISYYSDVYGGGLITGPYSRTEN